MAARSKRYRQALEGLDSEKLYSLEEAMSLIKGFPTGKFDESVDIAVNLGVDPKHADQMVRGAIVLPHSAGKNVRVLVFAKGDKADEAQAAGADVVGADDLVLALLVGILVRQQHGGAELHGIPGEHADVDDVGAGELVLEFHDPGLDPALALFRRMIFGILRQVAMFAGLGDRLDHGRSLDRLQGLQLAL